MTPAWRVPRLSCNDKPAQERHADPNEFGPKPEVPAKRDGQKGA